MRTVYLFFLVAVFSCNNNTDDKQVSTTDTVTHTHETTNSSNDRAADTVRKDAGRGNLSGCYQYILQRDTMVAHLKQSGNNISGKLSFDNYQKDGSSGAVTGTVKGDLIKLLYSFESEGMKSVMEVYFKKTAEGLVRATGDMHTKGDTAYFKNPQGLNFPDKTEFKKVDCSAVKIKYKLTAD